MGLALALGAQEAEQLARPVPAHAIGHQHLHALADLEVDSVQKQVCPLVVERGAMKLLHRLIQIARQPRDRLRADRLAGQRSYHAAHLARGNAAQKRLPDQNRQLRCATLELLHRPGKKTLVAGPCIYTIEVTSPAEVFCLTLRDRNWYTGNAGWSSPVARWAHNPKVGGSNPPPATNSPQKTQHLRRARREM